MDNSYPEESDLSEAEESHDGVFAPSKGSSRGGSHRWVPPTPAEVAPLFPNYEVLEILGRGGMGAVYKARQISLDRIVALKLLPLEVSVDESFANRFRREARALAKLSHPHIVAIHDFGQTPEGHLYFAMEYVEGGNLADVIHQIGLSPEQALALAGQICSALAYAHDKGVIHRDIKPSNVMIDMDSQAKVADFGLARVSDRSTDTIGHTMSGTVMGTIGYMAPEQMLDMNVDHRVDIYSLGVMFYEMLCGETPQGVFSLPSERIGCDVRIDQIVIKAMQQAPDRRYQTTYEMESAVESARLPPPPAATQARFVVTAHPLAVPVLKPKKSHGGIIAVFILLLLAAAAIFLVKFKPKWALQSATSPPESAVAGATPIGPEFPPAAVPAPGEPVRHLTAEQALKRLVSNKGWQDVEITTIPDGTLSVQISDRSISDLSPLAGLPVSELTTHGALVTDLSPLVGLPLRVLRLDHTPVDDVSRLRTLPLLELSLSNTKVSDLSPLCELKLQRLTLDGNEQEIDMAPLAGMATLENIVLPAHPVQIEVLRNLPNLKFISYQRGEGPTQGSATPAADFWRSYDEKMSTAVESPPVVKTAPEDPQKPLSATGRWLADQEPGWQARYANEVSEPFERGAAGLKKQYISKLEAQIAAAETSRRKEISSALRSELKLLAAGGKVPREDEITTPPMLKSLRATYRKTLADRASERIGNAKIVHSATDAVLAKYLSLLTQGRRLDEVAEIKAKREQLAAAWLESPPIMEASKERPFVNSLGMKFVPVPIKGGPSGGQRVLFSVWETRVQDYEAFVNETKREWLKSAFPQAPTHPVGNVLYSDAQDFCVWLTERERESGRLGSDEIYRLPTDHEWSCAVGLGTREDASQLPMEKSRKIIGEFPWGSTWPAPPGIGNLSGQESVGQEIWSGQRPIPGYRDDFPLAAPVGSFSAHPSGLFDLAGNFWEICQPVTGSIIHRGGSFAGITPEEFLSSNRRAAKFSYREGSMGFRPVVAVEKWEPLRLDPTGMVEKSCLEFLPDGWVRIVRRIRLKSPGKYKNVAMRARYRNLPDAANRLILRDDGEENNYFAELEGDGRFATVNISTKAKSAEIATITNWVRFPLRSPITAGAEYGMELRALGDEITLLVNDELLGSVRDKTHASRGFCAFFLNSGEFRNAAYRVLEGEPESP